MLRPNTEQIYYAMARKIMSRKELSEKSGVSESTLYKVITKGFLSKPELLGKIAQALEVNIEEIIISENDS